MISSGIGAVGSLLVAFSGSFNVCKKFYYWRMINIVDGSTGLILIFIGRSL